MGNPSPRFCTPPKGFKDIAAVGRHGANALRSRLLCELTTVVVGSITVRGAEVEPPDVWLVLGNFPTERDDRRGLASIHFIGNEHSSRQRIASAGIMSPYSRSSQTQARASASYMVPLRIGRVSSITSSPLRAAESSRRFLGLKGDTSKIDNSMGKQKKKLKRQARKSK